MKTLKFKVRIILPPPTVAMAVGPDTRETVVDVPTDTGAVDAIQGLILDRGREAEADRATRLTPDADAMMPRWSISTSTGTDLRNDTFSVST
jgi:hypothetical protein